MKILLAVDGSPSSHLAVEEVARRNWPEDTLVHLVAVEPPIEPPLLRGMPTVFDQVMKQQRAETIDHLNDAAETIRRHAPGLHVQPRLLEGSPKDVIIDEAERWGADLVVVGSHGHGPIRRFFLGSVSLYVAHQAPCSVLIVRHPRGDGATPNATTAA